MAFPQNANGDTSAVDELNGKLTQIDYLARGIAVDQARNVYVANWSDETGWVTVYAAGSWGDVAPIQTINGPSTGLDPTAIAVDANRNIYVANYRYNNLEVFGAGSNGNVAPTRTIGGANTELDYPEGVAVDASGRVYATTGFWGGIQAILVFAAGANGNVAPIQTIAGSNTGLNLPADVAVDSNDNIYVSNTCGYGCGAVTVYAADASGNVAPIQTISGSATELDGPIGIAVDSVKNIYVSNTQDWYGQPGTITVYSAGSSGNVAPFQTISGTNTRLLYPAGLAVR